MSGYRERAVSFGNEGRLKGVLTLPTGSRASRVLGLVNAGFVPRYGPYRVYVQMARRLADRGCAVLRFDLGGLGDSLPTVAGQLRERTLTDIGAAVDYLVSELPGAEVAVGGICSGAEDALRAAESDSRIARLLLVDPFAYRTAGWTWRHTRHRLWRRALRAVGMWRPAAGGAAGIIDYRYMEREESGRILAALVKRGARLHFVYTGGRREAFNHPAQLVKMFPEIPLRGSATVDHLPGIEHTQYLQGERDVLIAAVEGRILAGS